MKQFNQLQTGFTLFELLITLAVATILFGVAVPSFTSMTKSNRITTTVNDLVYALNIARSEAMKSNSAATCISTDLATCTVGGTWASGWIVFADLNANCSVDAGENLIKVFEPISNASTTIVTTPAKRCVRYGSNGFISPPGDAPLAFKFCDDRTGVKIGRTVSLIVTGRPTTTATDCP